MILTRLRADCSDKRKNVLTVSVFGKKRDDSASKWREFTANMHTPAPDAERKRLGGRALLVARLLALTCAFGILLAVPGLVAVNAAVGVGDAGLKVWNAIPASVDGSQVASKSRVLDRDGNVIAELWDENREELASLDQVSGWAQTALVDTEDQRFWEHEGYDPQGVARSAVSGEGGGSGITQQLVKNLRYYSAQSDEGKSEATAATLARKVVELKAAVEYEKQHSKSEILLAYFNTVAFGGPSTYSIQSAARAFFGVDASDLSAGQAALLVGSVQNPSLYNMSTEDGAERARERARLVVGRMKRLGHVTEEQEADALSTIDAFTPVESGGAAGGCASSKYPFYCDYVVKYILGSPRYGETADDRERLLSVGGLTIKTFLDSAATDAVEAQLRADFGTTNRVAVPTVGVDPGTGGVSVYAVNRDYGSGAGETMINLPLNPAGTGSTFKMLVLAAALNNGYDTGSLSFSSACPLYPGPDYDSPDGGINNSDSCALQGGFLSYRQAAAYSSNTWFATLEMRIGVDKVKDFAASVGIPAPESISSRSLSYGLGSTEHSPVDMAAVFASFASGGVFCPATPVQSVTGVDGVEVAPPDGYDPSADACRRVLSPHAAAVVADAMHANMDGSVPSAFGLRYRVPGYDVAAKSGSNNVINSTWAVVTGGLALFSNVYDPVSTAEGMDFHEFRGHVARWNDHAVAQSAASYLPGVFAAHGYSPAVYQSSDMTAADAAPVSPGGVEVPSLVGLSAEAAVAVGESSGLRVVVDRERSSSGGVPSGFVAWQSVEAGSRLLVGSRREVVVRLSE